MDLDSRTRKSQISLWDLPEELIVCTLKGLHIKDVLNMRTVSSFFRDMIDDCSTVWKEASFQDTWPSPNNLRHFKKATEFGNMEALIKMAIAHLYVIGVPPYANERYAIALMCQIETRNPFEPFMWLFCRPNASHIETLRLFYYMKETMEDYIQKNDEQDTKNLSVCVAKNILLFVPSWYKEKVDVHLNNARRLGSGCAAFLLWQKEYHDILSADEARQLEGIQQLREIAKMNYFESKLLLCRMYGNGLYGGITEKQAAMFVQEIVQSANPANTQECFKTSPELTTAMRYNLVNCLVEIAREKNFCSHTLHITISVVDRYLKRHKTTASELKLVGVSAIALCSRILEEKILPNNKAADLIFDLYHCSCVERMVGEITATLKGNIQVPNSLDFVEILSSVAGLDGKGCRLAEYVCEMTLLHAEMGQYSPAEIAASSVLLARLLMKLDMPWPDKMTEFSGFTIENIRRCAFHIHEKCFLQDHVLDHRGLQPEAVKRRYLQTKFHRVSRVPIMSYEELCADLPLPHMR